MVLIKYMQEETQGAVLEAIKVLTGKVDSLTEGVHGLTEDVQGTTEAVGVLAENIQEVSDRTERIETRLGNVETRVGKIETSMVTKSYLDDKLADLKGDMISVLRKEDKKTNHLINILAHKRILSVAESKDALSIKVFP